MEHSEKAYTFLPPWQLHSGPVSLQCLFRLNVFWIECFNSSLHAQVIFFLVFMLDFSLVLFRNYLVQWRMLKHLNNHANSKTHRLANSSHFAWMRSPSVNRTMRKILLFQGPIWEFLQLERREKLEILCSALMKINAMQGTAMQGTTHTHLMMKSQQDSSSLNIRFPGLPCLTRSPLPKSNRNDNPSFWEP